MITLALRGLRTAIRPSIYKLQPPSSSINRYSSSTKTTRTAQTIRIDKSTTTDTPRSLLNGPLSTHPPPLNLPTRETSSSTFSYFFALGRTYASFYKSGAKAIYTNYKLTRPLHSLHSKYPSISSAITSNALTRSDFLLLHRARHDLKRVPVFALVFLVCGEFTPLVVIALSSAVPWTCRIPNQILKDRQTLETRRAISFRNLTAQLPEGKGVQGMERMQVLHISWSLGLSSSAWDWLGGTYPGLPTWVLKRKVASRVRYLGDDDRLLGDVGRVGELEGEEVRMALVERGVDVVGREEWRMRADLVAWLQSRKRVGVERLLLTRPSVWPVKPRYMTETGS